MSHPYKGFEPKWVKGEFPADSYRSIFKWGAPLEIKPPKESLYKLMKEKFHLSDADFKSYREEIGFDHVAFDLPIHLTQSDLIRLPTLSAKTMCAQTIMPAFPLPMARRCMMCCACATRSSKTYRMRYCTPT